MTEEKNILAKIIMQQIMSGQGADGKHGQICWMSWGAEKPRPLDQTHDYRGGLVFKTDGFKHKGKVFVWLSWMDTYSLEFLPDDGSQKTVIHDIYCDNLTFAIDKNVEYSERYDDDIVKDQHQKQYTLGELFG